MLQENVLRVVEPRQVRDCPDLSIYDRFVAFFSGGKDSISGVLLLLEMGVPPDLIELHHHDVDGMEGSRLMDWPVTRSYCRAFAQALGLRLYTSWKEGGFEREMLRCNQRTAPTVWEREDGTFGKSGGEGGKLGTRRRFPQTAADLQTRWCSAYCKVDIGARVLTSELRFRSGKTLVFTGERAFESAARARYSTFENHRSDNRSGPRVQRWIDHWRAVHAWPEQQVWEILRRWRINPHPAYWLHWGRTSCMCCIFGSANQWATIRAIAPEKFERIALYEEEFGSTIHRTLSVRQLANRGTPYETDPSMVEKALSRDYSAADIIVPEGQWKLPPGAFGESNGPT